MVPTQIIFQWPNLLSFSMSRPTIGPICFLQCFFKDDKYISTPISFHTWILYSVLFVYLCITFAIIPMMWTSSMQASPISAGDTFLLLPQTMETMDNSESNSHTFYRTYAELEQALIVPGVAGRWKMSPCPPRSLTTLPASGIVQFWSIMEAGAGGQAQLPATFFPSMPSSFVSACGSCYIVLYGYDASAS